MKVIISGLLVLGLVGCGTYSRVINKHYGHTYGVDRDQWAVCVDRCGDAGLTEAVLKLEDKSRWLMCHCSDLSQIRVDLPTEATVEKEEEVKPEETETE